MRETLLFLTHRYTYLCTPAWEYGGVSHCQLLSWIHTESKTSTHVHYTCVQMWLQQELHLLVHACPCRYAPVWPRGASLRHLRAAEKQHLFVRRTLVQRHVYMCSADAEACHSSIGRKRGSAESGSRAGRGY